MNDTKLIRKFISKLWGPDDVAVRAYLHGNKPLKNDMMNYMVNTIINETGVEDKILIEVCINHHLDYIHRNNEISKVIKLDEMLYL